MYTPPIANPFNNGIVPDAWVEPVVDVPSIHADVSDLCLELVREVAQHHKRRSILIHGAAGSGKTHTLSRLRSALIAADGRPRPLFSYVRLTTSPNMIRRHLRSCLTRDLIRKDDRGGRHLESLLIESLTKETGVAPTPGELQRLGENPKHSGSLRVAFDEMCNRLGIDHHVASACRLFLLRQHRHAVIQWLETGELPDTAGPALRSGIGTQEEETPDAEHVAFRATLQLIALVTDTRPLVLCFDQLEAMQMSEGDRAGYFAYGKLAADLFDHCASTLLITCIQSSARECLTQAVPAHDRHRLAQYEMLLARLTEQQAREFIRARLDSSPALRVDPRRRHDPLWPIGEQRFREFLADDDATPRRLCALGREAFLEVSQMPREINPYLSAVFEQRRGEVPQPTSLDDGVIHGMSLLLAARGFSVTAPDDRDDVDLVVALPPRSICVSVVNDEGNSLTRRLKQIVDRPPASHEERVLVREVRRPIPMSAKKAWEYWNLLLDRSGPSATGMPRVRSIAPTTEVVASLEAIRSIVSDARAGDLDCNGASILAPVIEAWIRGHLHDAAIDRFVAELLAGSATADASVGPVHRQAHDAAAEILQRRHIMFVEDLAMATRHTVEELRTLLASDGSTFGTLGSPPLVVFDRSLLVM
jgi:hypothetical protein